MATTEAKISKQERVAFGCLGGKALWDEFNQERERDALLWPVNVSERVAREFLYSPDQEDAVDKYIALLKDLRGCFIAAAQGEEQPERFQQLLKEWVEQPLLLSGAAHWLFLGLFYRGAGATESTLYVCRYCGRIGEATRSSKHFCGSKCRSYYVQEIELRHPRSITGWTPKPRGS